MVSKQIYEVKDFFTEEVASILNSGECATFGLNCGATFRSPIRLLSRIQKFLVDNHDVKIEDATTTSKAIQMLLKCLKVVSQDESALYFDTRKESVIIEEQEKSKTAKADTSKNSRAKVFIERISTALENGLVNKSNFSDKWTAFAEKVNATDSETAEVLKFFKMSLTKIDEIPDF